MPRGLLLPLLLALLARLHAVLGIAIESLHVPNSVPERMCPDGKGLFEDICCDFCPKGKVVEHGCTQTSGVKCKLCTEGKEYMDHQNLSPKCRRCSHCDTEHGMEVEENCTSYQNIKCRCKPDFFCRSEQCQHCDPCTKCEEGTYEECTQTKDAVCKSKGNLLWLCGLIPIAPTALLIFCYLRNKRLKKDYSVPQHPDDERFEMEENFPDVDLSPYISDIATVMTKKQVMKLVRKLGIQNGIIDTVVEDNANDTAELKIALLQTWYEQNGMRGAHEKLIRNLRQLKFHSTADKIEQKLKR